MAKEEVKVTILDRQFTVNCRKGERDELLEAPRPRGVARAQARGGRVARVTQHGTGALALAPLHELEHDLLDDVAQRARGERGGAAGEQREEEEVRLASNPHRGDGVGAQLGDEQQIHEAHEGLQAKGRHGGPRQLPDP